MISTRICYEFLQECIEKHGTLETLNPTKGFLHYCEYFLDYSTFLDRYRLGIYSIAKNYVIQHILLISELRRKYKYFA